MLFRRSLTMPAILVTAMIFIFEYSGSLVAFLLGTILTSVPLLLKGRSIGSCDRSQDFSGDDQRNSMSADRSFCLYMALILMWITLAHLHGLQSEDRYLPKLHGKATEVRGIIHDIDLRSKGDEHRMMILLKTEYPCKKEKILINAPAGEHIAVGDRIRTEGKLKIPDAKTNPNTFDYGNYLKTMGVYTTMYSEQPVLITGSSNGLQAELYRSKVYFLDELESIAGESTSNMMRAILFGDKGCLDDDIQETFRMNGTAHILAVSGLHVGMIYALILAVFNRMGGLMAGASGGGRGWLFLIMTGAILTMYAMVSGFAPSVIRAVLMIMLHIFAGFSGRFYDLKSAGMAVYLAVLIKEPLMLFQSGFQMSFLAIMSLSIVLPYMRGFLKGSLLAGVSIQIGLMPYMIYQFNWFSWASALINLPVIFLAGLLVPLGMVAFTISIIAGILQGNRQDLGADPIGLVSLLDRVIGFLCEVMVKLNELCLIEGVTAIRVCSPPVWMVVLFYAALVAFVSESGRLRMKRMGRKVFYLQAIVILALSLTLGSAIDDGFKRSEMVFVDVGQGDCMHIRVNSGLKLPGGVNLGVGTKNYLIDGGGSDDYNVGRKTLKPYLLKNGVRTVDGAFVTHLHTDHYKGICELAREGMVDKLYLYESNRLKLDRIRAETGMVEDDVIFLKKGDRIVLSKTLTGRVTAYMDVLWPEEKSDAEYRDLIENEEDENASSLILRAVVEGVSLLATGDLGEEGEKEILGAYPRPSTADNLCSDILKVGHHGSRYSTCNEFLDAVSPSLAVIQVSKGNTYGHPTPEVLKKLADRGIPTYRNDLQGAIGFSLSGGSIKEVRTMIE